MVFVLKINSIIVDHVLTNLSISCHDSEASDSLDCALSARKKTHTRYKRSVSCGARRKNWSEQKGERGEAIKLFSLPCTTLLATFCLAVFRAASKLSFSWIEKDIGKDTGREENKQTKRKRKVKHLLSISSVGVSLRLGLSVVLLVGLVPRRHSSTWNVDSIRITYRSFSRDVITF